ncbi:MAG: phosphoribosylanthranilate isomerase [Burkholderiaceae bacterium]|nr:phosphoribosylanthranilate isomerase [Burkholderiaceae bacterium]
MRRTRIKICGVTRPEDVDAAASMGADAVGFVMYPPSARAVSLEQASTLARRLPAFVTPVLLFVEPTRNELDEAVCSVPNAMIQFHGHERADFCEEWAKQARRTYLRSVPIPIAPSVNVDLVEWQQRFASAAALLLDTQSSGYGGSGSAFDWNSIAWSQLPTSVRARIVLSGGLSPANVGEAIERVRPFAVDVSSGVESQQRGIKDADKIKAFIAAVRAADARCAAEERAHGFTSQRSREC